MNLPFFGKKEKKEYFLALLLRDENVTAAIFEEEKGKAHVISKYEERLAKPLEGQTFDEWLEIFDTVISQAENTLQEGVEVQKTIFGVKENWVEGEKIKKEYLLRLKKASDALGLTPIGFLVIYEAIAHLLQQEEGAPVSAILVEIQQQTVGVALIRAGRVMETKRTKLEESVAKITDRLLHHFTNYEVLPSRIIVLSDKDENDSLSQVFIGHSWSKSLPFLHVPQITILPKNFDAKAVIYGAASQMGFEVLLPEYPQQQLPEEKQEQEEEENFGFIKEKDIKNTEVPEKPKISAIDTITEEIIDEEKEEKVVLIFTTAKEFFTSFFKKAFSLLKIIKLPSSGILPNAIGRKKIFLFPLFFIVILIISLVLYIVFLKADVLLTVTPKIIAQNQNITFSTKSKTDVSKRIIAAKTIDATETGKITKPATGKKEIGEKAKGTITIYSTLRKEQSFNKGITVTASNNIAFSLDETVKVASASGASDVKTVKAQIAAKDIGKESNLPSGMKFTIASFDASEVEAKNDTAFSGGTKKEVTVVSKKDIDLAITDLTENLERLAKENMNKKVGDANKLLPFIVDTNFSQKSADKKVDEEAQNLTIVGSVTYIGLSYSEDEAKELAQNLLKEQLENDSFEQSNVTYEIKNTKEKSDKEASGQIEAKAFLLPKYEKEKIAKQVAGNSFADAKRTILKLPQVSAIDIRLKPQLPFLPGILPRLSQNITITVEKE